MATIAAGCASWTPTTAPVTDVVRQHETRTLRVTQTNGQRTVLLRPTLTDSILFGTAIAESCWRDIYGVRTCRGARVEVQIPAGEISLIEAPYRDPVARGALVGGAGFGAITFAVILSEASFCRDYMGECVGTLVVTSLVGTAWGALMGAVLN